ncbi:MAG: hypothetical protein RL260_2126 [Pseudomonadota bacterium]|jgi:AraC-like DNA-binding protein
MMRKNLESALTTALAAAQAGQLVVHRPQHLGEPQSRGDGHFHLTPELFVQVEGWTDFRFPHGGCRLAAGEVLIVPPQLRHDEHVGATRGAAFRNVVVNTAGPALMCHLAHEHSPGSPGIAHLETRHHAQAARIHDWLFHATQSPSNPAQPWADAQARALVAAALAGVLLALNASEGDTGREPPLIARLRVLIQNQLGDHTLSVRRLAEQSGCTADYLSHLFREITGEALIGCINRLRMERAARLLRETTLAVKEVAWACGFAAPSYFIRSFRGHHGVTPKAWREGAVPPGPAPAC